MTKTLFSLDGKRIVLTGAAGFFGRYFAKALLDRGARTENGLQPAVSKGHADTVRAMLAHKVDPDAAGGRGSALIDAVNQVTGAREKFPPRPLWGESAYGPGRDRV